MQDMQKTHTKVNGWYPWYAAGCLILSKGILGSYGLVGFALAWMIGLVSAATWHIPQLLDFAVGGAALLFMLIQWSYRTRRILLLLLFCFCAGAWRYALTQPDNDPQAIAHAIGHAVVEVKGSVSTEPELSGRTRLLKVAVSAISRSQGTSWSTAHGTLEVQTLSTDMEDAYGAEYGDEVTLEGKLTTPSTHATGDVQASMSFPRIVIGTNGGNPLIAQLYHLRVYWATIITQVLPQPLAALLIAIVLGLRTPTLKPLTLLFNVTGTAHLIVPSGFKVTIVASIILSCTKWLQTSHLRRYIPGWHANSGRWLQTTLVITGIALYTILSGAGAAALRSGIMGSLLVLAPRIGRIYNIYTALAFSALIMSMQDPTVLWDVGFQLSFLGTLGIVLFTPFIERHLHFLSHLPGGSIIAENCAVTLAAELATLPIFAITFQQISFIAPLANVLTVPLLGILIILGLLICLLGSIALPLAAVVGWIVWPLLWYTSQIITYCASLPYAHFTVLNIDTDTLFPWLYYLFLVGTTLGLYTWQTIHAGKKIQQISHPIHTPQKSRQASRLTKRTQRLLYVGGALLLIGITTLIPYQNQTGDVLTINFLHVGPTGQPAQGEALFIRTADNKTILIDGGPDPTSLAQALDSHFPPWQRSLNLVMLTVPRADHLTGLQDVIMRYSVEMVVDAGMLHPNTTYARWRRTISEQKLHYRAVGQGQTLSLGSQLRLEILWPPLNHLHAGSTEVLDNGLIARLSAPGIHMLLLGATAQSRYALREIIQNRATNDLQAEIVQIAGGVDQLAMPELADILQAAHPSLLVVSPSTTRRTRSSNQGATKSIQTLLASYSLANIRTIQTAQTGEFTITATIHGWTSNTF
jgi:ComEC/Rec2-related protein